MGHYNALGEIIRKTVNKLQEREDIWLMQEEKALEALQWCEILNDREGMDRLCAIFERTGGMESAAVHQNLKRIFNDMAAPDTLRLQALGCLNRTDWSKANDNFIFGTRREQTKNSSSLEPLQLVEFLISEDPKARNTAAQSLLTLGARPQHGKDALEIFRTVAGNATLAPDVRRDAGRNAETLHVAQLARLQALVTGLEKDAYAPRPRLIPAR